MHNANRTFREKRTERLGFPRVKRRFLKLKFFQIIRSVIKHIWEYKV